MLYIYNVQTMTFSAFARSQCRPRPRSTRDRYQTHETKTEPRQLHIKSETETAANWPRESRSLET